MVVDCRTSVLKGRYYDSKDNNPAADRITNMNVARHLLHGLKLLFQDVPGFEEINYTIEEHTPLQGRGNKSGFLDGGSACGPFVFLIIKEIVQYIVECYEDGAPEAIGDLSLPEDFAARLQWDSMYTRQVIQGLIDRELHTRKWLNRTAAWFDLRPQPGNATGWQTWLRGRGMLDTGYVWDPRGQPVEFAPWFNDPTV
jgi:hypothetical protein